MKSSRQNESNHTFRKKNLAYTFTFSGNLTGNIFINQQSNGADEITTVKWEWWVCLPYRRPPIWLLNHHTQPKAETSFVPFHLKIYHWTVEKYQRVCTFELDVKLWGCKLHPSVWSCNNAVAQCLLKSKNLQHGFQQGPFPNTFMRNSIWSQPPSKWPPAYI